MRPKASQVPSILLYMAPKLTAQITVVTIAKDNAEGLEQTLTSLLAQTASNWVSVIVVGVSRDDTLAVAFRFAKLDNRIIVKVQQDSGIYEAMNLGSQNISTSHVWYMNSGDLFKSSDSLQIGLLAAQKNRNIPLIVGHHEVQNSTKKFNSKSGDLHPFSFAFSRRGLCHQAMIFNTGFLSLQGVYNQNFRYCADYDLVLRLVNNYGGVRIPDILCSIEPGGVSDTNLRKVHKEKHSIRKQIFYRKYWISAYGRVWVALLFLKVGVRNRYISLRGKIHE